MSDSRDAVHYGFERNGDLLFDLLGGNPRPLCNDIDVVIRNVGIRLNRQALEGNDAPRKQQDRYSQHQKAILQREVYEPADHCVSNWFSN